MRQKGRKMVKGEKEKHNIDKKKLEKGGKEELKINKKSGKRRKGRTKN